MCERTVLTVLKSILSNTFHRGEGCRRLEDVKMRIFPSSARRQPSRRLQTLLKNDFKTVDTVLSHTFNHKICFKYAVYIVGCVWFVLTVKFSCLFTAVAVLACLRSLIPTSNSPLSPSRSGFDKSSREIPIFSSLLSSFALHTPCSCCLHST